MKYKKKPKHLKIFLQIFSICILICILAAYAGKEKTENIPVDTSGAADINSEDTEGEEGSGETTTEITKIAGMPGEDGVVLTDVKFEKSMLFKESEVYDPVQFVFSDGTVEKRQLSHALWQVKYFDVTGDGIREVLLEGWGTLDIFQIESKEITELSFIDEFEELQGRNCDIEFFYVNRGGRKGYALEVKTYKKQEDEKVLDQKMEIFYENGKWIRLPERKFEPEVSLEFDSEEAGLYESFLQGECSAEVSEHYYDAIRHSEMVPFGNNRENFYLRDVLESIIWWDGGVKGYPFKGVDRVRYGLIDCGGGTMKLAVEILGVHIYSGMDDSSVLMVFDCKDGKMELIYGVDTWARREVHLCSDGSIWEGGSGGATLHGLEKGKIGADGVYRMAYDMEIGSGQDVGEMEGCPANSGEGLSAVFYLCRIEDETIYAYDISEDASEDEKQRVMEHVAENEKRLGLKFMTYEAMDALCDARVQKLGISDYYDEGKKIWWSTLNGCEEYLY